jgi:hypothetical protein
MNKYGNAVNRIMKILEDFKPIERDSILNFCLSVSVFNDPDLEVEVLENESI